SGRQRPPADRLRCERSIAISGAFFASSAIRCCFVETDFDPDISIVFPFNSFMIRHSLPSTGSHGLVPPLHQYYGMFRLADASLASPRSPSALQYQFGTHRSLPKWLRAAAQGQGTLIKTRPHIPALGCEL